MLRNDKIRRDAMSAKWEVQKRLEEIEKCLYWGGSLNRGSLRDKFGISAQQASADIALYNKQFPDSMVFNTSLKTYEPVKNYQPNLIKLSLSSCIDWLNIEGFQVATIFLPKRKVDINILRDLTQALHQNQSITITYRSMTNASGETRRITPHTLVDDGFRLHVRAYCHKRDDFRDFVIGRIVSTGEINKPGKGKFDDDEWNTIVELKIGPHPELTDEQRGCIESDYGMEEGCLTLKVKKALMHYTLSLLKLDDQQDARTPIEQQIVRLQNG